MNDERWERLAPLTGVVFVVLLVVGVLLINNYDYLPPAGDIQSFYTDNSTTIAVGAFVASLSVFFFLWFLGSVLKSLRSAEGGAGRLSAIAFGGGVAVAAGMIVAYAATMAAAQRAGATGGISADTAVGFFDLSGTLMGSIVPMAFAALTGATAVVSFRTQTFSPWFRWVTAIVAIGLLTPINYIFVGLAVFWVLIISIILYTSPSTSS